MPRRAREAQDGAYYHIIARANNRLFIFQTPRDFLLFKVLLRRSKSEHPWKLHHYCLMSNHFHLLVYVEKGGVLPKAMHALLSGYSRFYRKKTGYQGHVWQGRYKSILIEKESYLLQCAAYIERNPVRAGMVRRPWDYTWSSAPAYSRNVSDSLVDRSPYWESFGAETSERLRRYADFVSAESPYDLKLDKDLFIA